MLASEATQAPVFNLTSPSALRQVAVAAIAIQAITCTGPTNPGPTAQAPTVHSIAPSNGPLAGGTLVTIRGVGFAAGASVAIGSKPAADVTVTSTDVLTARTPAGTASSPVDVTVTVNGRSGLLAAGFRYDAIANNAPRLLSITLSTDRVEVGDEVTVTANVADDESSADALSFEWTATAGTISGTGRVVRWKAPTDRTVPANYRVDVVVVDKYAVGPPPLEHRVSGQSPPIYVDDSPRTVEIMAVQFLNEFGNNDLSPEYCVRNFSDSCSGKRREREDIADVREGFTVLQVKLGTPRVTVNSSRTSATVRVDCAFTSFDKQKKTNITAAGTCELRLVNESYRWWLCDSSMHDPNDAALTFPF